jgi:hypothetical protein
MNEHKKRCATCSNKRGTHITPAEYGHFYATDCGIMICTIDNKPISMEIYNKIENVGCASHVLNKENL